MSRIAKKPIVVGDKIKVELTTDPGGYLFKVVGPLGENSRFFKKDIKIEIDSEGIKLTPTSPGLLSQKALWGTYASHIKNMIAGVQAPYQKKLILEGVGFKSEVKGKEFNFALGFSHPVVIKIPEGITATADKNNITIIGIDKELVGSFTAGLRALKEAEPYKGKGMRYEKEVVRRKQGKKTA